MLYFYSRRRRIVDEQRLLLFISYRISEEEARGLATALRRINLSVWSEVFFGPLQKSGCKAANTTLTQ